MGAESGRTFLVTGGNTGIGLATATELARRGGRVYVACRSESKGSHAVASIVAETGNANVVYLPLDLADLGSVRACADAFLATGEPLHVLINNAGVAGRRGLTSDGFELTFGVNHLGHFALTMALLDRLADSAPGPGGLRVQRLALSGQGHRLHRPAPAHQGHHRPAGLRRVQAVQRAVRPGTGSPHRRPGDHHLCAAPGRGGVGHLAPGAVAGPLA